MKKSMEEKKKMPQIRFNGFNDDWEQLKLGELSSSFEYGLNAAAKEYDGKNKYIRITDIDDDSRKFKQEDITSPDTDLSSAENYRLSEGDILFTRTGASVGKSYIYKASDGLVYYAGFLIRAKIKKDYNPEFVFQNTLTNDYEKFIKITSMRSGQPGVNAQEYSQYQIMMPCKIEQDRISGYLRRLDNLITLHQHKCDQLRNLKKAMLKKMFPQDGVSIPELRFIGFTDTWEQRKLGTLCSLITKGTTPKDKSGNGEVNFIKVENIDIDNGEITSTSKISIVEHEGYLKRSKLKENDILFSIAGTLGRVSVVKSSILPANTNQALAILRINEGYIPYLTTVLKGQAVEDFIRRNPTIGAQPNLSLEQVNNLDISYPNYDEQVRIGQYFSNLDHLITLHQRKLEKLKVIKKSLLSKMFVDAD
jgi:type I restriction enzyme, S subunit